MTRLPGIFALAAVLGLGGCSESVTLKVEGDVPDALVAQLPLAVGVYYDQTFADYRYTENTEERSNWDISSGAAQVAVFDRVLESTFARVERLGAPPGSNDGGAYDIAMVPGIVEMQFATPRETGFEFFEAWIRYRIRLASRDGSRVEEWNVAAYGKAPVKRFMVRTDGLNEAIRYALRDVGAKLSTELHARPVIMAALAATP